MTVADIVRRAGIARNTFYENFGSKEECFLATQEYAMSTALERVVEAAGSFDEWPQRVRAGLAAFLGFVVDEPALARTCMVEALSAGPAAVRYYEESQQAFVSLFKLGRDVSPHGPDLPETLEEALIGGVFWIVYQRLTSLAAGSNLGTASGADRIHPHALSGSGGRSRGRDAVKVKNWPVGQSGPEPFESVSSVLL